MGLGTYMMSAVVWLLDVAGLQGHGIPCMRTTTACNAVSSVMFGILHAGIPVIDFS